MSVHVVKKINNNVALCIDSKGQELVAFGTGIGFPRTPYELTDMSKVTRTYYNVDPAMYGPLDEIPAEIFEIAGRLMDIAKARLDRRFNTNMAFSLADHINFAIQRVQSGMSMQFAFSYDVEALYPVEAELGKLALRMIRETCGVKLPKSEGTSIALHFINAEEPPEDDSAEEGFNQMADAMTGVVERYFGISVDKNAFDYYRFCSHLRYFLKRLRENAQFEDQDMKLFGYIREDYPKAYQCVKKMITCLPDNLAEKCNEQEKLYLTIYVIRLCNSQMEH